MGRLPLLFVLRLSFFVGFCFQTASSLLSNRLSVTLKLAVDSQGAVDDLAISKEERFTSDASLDLCHRLRASSQSVAVGINTVLRDNPSLTVLRVPLSLTGQQPLRVVFDRHFRIPMTCALMNDHHETLVFAETGHGRSSFSNILPAGNTLPAGKLVETSCCDLEAACNYLFSTRGISHLMVEGGPSVARSFLAAGLVDRAIIISSPIVFKSPVPSHIDRELLRQSGLESVREFFLEGDKVQFFSRPHLPWPVSSLPDARYQWP